MTGISMTAVYSLIRSGKIPAVPVATPINKSGNLFELEKRILKLLLLKVALMNRFQDLHTGTVDTLIKVQDCAISYLCKKILQ